MRLLLDAHTLIWTMDNPSQLSPTAAKALRDLSNELFLSAGTIWELSIKVGNHKLSLSLPFEQWIHRAIADLGLQELPIRVRHAAAQADLPPHHRDPFDRLLIAQSFVESLTVVSVDSLFDQYGATRLW